MSFTRYYSIYVIDGTPLFNGFTPATTPPLKHTEEASTPDRPPLAHVLLWIDSQAPAVREAANTMRKNPGTTTIYLEARLPIEPGLHDTPKHKYIGNEDKIDVVGGLEIEELKKRVSAMYEVA